MNGGRLGYVPSQAVELVKQENGLTYEVTETREATPTFAPISSRGGLLRGSADARSQMVDEALRLEGSTPYKWGGNEIGSGIDCSGFVKKMYGAIGYSLPRTAAEQAMVGVPITRLEQLQAGDRLYFYESKRGMIGHTGIYVGNGYFVHSSSGHKGDRARLPQRALAAHPRRRATIEADAGGKAAGGVPAPQWVSWIASGSEARAARARRRWATNSVGVSGCPRSTWTISCWLPGWQSRQPNDFLARGRRGGVSPALDDDGQLRGGARRRRSPRRGRRGGSTTRFL